MTSNKDKKLISTLKNQLLILRRDYSRCKKKLESVLIENAELKKRLGDFGHTQGQCNGSRGGPPGRQQQQQDEESTVWFSRKTFM